MSVTIDGTGTVTGLSTGGLPDGSIAAADLATDAVTGAKIADDAITLAKMASGTDGNIISYDASGNPVAIATGSDGQVLTSAGAGAPCAFETLTTGKVLQVVNTQTGAIITGTTLHVLDDTIPQKTEGFEVMTLAITPASASNKLKINVTVHTASSTASTLHITALFQDATANALAVGGVNMERTGDDIGTTSFTHYMAAGTTSETTFKVRTGTNGGATLSINGQVGNRLFGGVFISSITITEIAV